MRARVTGGLRALGRRLLCAIGDHQWTCKAEQGIPPSPERQAADPLGYFSEYSRGYCLHCGERMEEREREVSIGDTLLILLVIAAAGFVVTRSPTPVQDVGPWPSAAVVDRSELYYGAPRDTTLREVCCPVLPEVR